MLETKYQSKIIKSLEKLGGRCVNGQFSKAGEADLQCGYPYGGRLYDLAIEVKTEKAYKHIMSGIELVEGRYKVFNSSVLKQHEKIQIIKLNKVRDLGGLAILAWDFKQVQDYCERELR